MACLLAHEGICRDKARAYILDVACLADEGGEDHVDTLPWYGEPW